jgi:hypothetical protein
MWLLNIWRLKKSAPNVGRYLNFFSISKHVISTFWYYDCKLFCIEMYSFTWSKRVKWIIRKSYLRFIELRVSVYRQAYSISLCCNKAKRNDHWIYVVCPACSPLKRKHFSWSYYFALFFFSSSLISWKWINICSICQWNRNWKTSDTKHKNKYKQTTTEVSFIAVLQIGGKRSFSLAYARRICCP